MLIAHAHPSRRWASGFGRALSWLGVAILAPLALVSAAWTALFGVAILAPLALVSAAWTALFVVAVAMSIAVHVRTQRRRWELDEPGADARFRFGARASRGVRLADVAGVVVVHAPGASSRGIPITRDAARWWLVDDAGRALGQANTEGIDPVDVERFRSALGVPFVPLAVARRAAAVPEGHAVAPAAPRRRARRRDPRRGRRHDRGRARAAVLVVSRMRG